jgi:hypothetical protein
MTEREFATSLQNNVQLTSALISGRSLRKIERASPRIAKLVAREIRAESPTRTRSLRDRPELNHAGSSASEEFAR